MPDLPERIEELQDRLDLQPCRCPYLDGDHPLCVRCSSLRLLRDLSAGFEELQSSLRLAQDERDHYRGLLDRCGHILWKDFYISRDGAKHGPPTPEFLPSVVANLVQTVREQHKQIWAAIDGGRMDSSP